MVLIKYSMRVNINAWLFICHLVIVALEHTNYEKAHTNTHKHNMIGSKGL